MQTSMPEHWCMESCYALRCADKNNFALTIHALELCCSPLFYISRITAFNSCKKPFCRWTVEYKSKDPSHRYTELARESFKQILLHKPTYIRSANKGMIMAPYLSYQVEYNVNCGCDRPVDRHFCTCTIVSRSSVSGQFIEGFGNDDQKSPVADMLTPVNEDISNIKMEEPVAGVSAEVSEDFVNIKFEHPVSSVLTLPLHNKDIVNVKVEPSDITDVSPL